MAARSKYPAPHEQLLVLARRARIRGLPFEDFWEEAVRPDLPPVMWQTPPEKRPSACVIWPNDTQDRNLSRAATEDARSGWRRAYEGLPPAREEVALARLGPLLDAALGGNDVEQAVPSAA
jgi:hypothetical protein